MPIFLALSAIAAICTIIAAWIAHVVVCIKTASWFLLIIGIFVPPIGFVHGIGSWFGLF